MSWQDWALLVGTLVAAIELVFIIAIFSDDHKQRKLAEESIVIQRESLVAQKDYLALRRRWYEQRQKKEKKVDAELQNKGPQVAPGVDGQLPQ